MSERAPNVRAALRVGLVLVVVGGGTTLRVVLAGEAEIAAGTAALDAGDVDEAIARSESAASWYAPGAPHVRIAYARLAAIAAEAESRKLRATALAAHRAVVSASRGSRWIVTPHGHDAQRSVDAIARLEATGPRPPGTADEPARAIEQAQLAALGRSAAPRAVHTAALVGAFAAMVVGLGALLRRAFDATGRLDAGRARLPAAIALVGALGYVVALFLA